MILLYVLAAVAIALAWFYVIGAFAFGLGFAVTGVVKIMRRKYIPGVACLIVAAVSIVLVYAWVSGVLVL